MTPSASHANLLCAAVAALVLAQSVLSASEARACQVVTKQVCMADLPICRDGLSDYCCGHLEQSLACDGTPTSTTPVGCSGSPGTTAGFWKWSDPQCTSTAVSSCTVFAPTPTVCAGAPRVILGVGDGGRIASAVRHLGRRGSAVRARGRMHR